MPVGISVDRTSTRALTVAGRSGVGSGGGAVQATRDNARSGNRAFIPGLYSCLKWGVPNQQASLSSATESLPDYRLDSSCRENETVSRCKRSQPPARAIAS